MSCAKSNILVGDPTGLHADDFVRVLEEMGKDVFVFTDKSSFEEQIALRHYKGMVVSSMFRNEDVFVDSVKRFKYMFSGSPIVVVSTNKHYTMQIIKSKLPDCRPEAFLGKPCYDEGASSCFSSVFGNPGWELLN